MGFTKLFSDIVTSSIWSEDNETRIVWITLLAIAGPDGIARAAMPSLARVAGVSLEKTGQALDKFQQPDQYSRSQENEGRRIQRVEGGWLLLNYQRYRSGLNSDERREYKRIKQQQYRSKRKSVSEAYKANERRFVKAHENGDQAACDKIASEGL